MSSVYFEQFNLLWKRVEAKFTNENSEPFTLENLHHQLTGLGLSLRQIDLDNIKKKFLEPIAQENLPENINLSDGIYKVLFNYVGIKGFPDLIGVVDHEKVLEEVRAKRNNKPMTTNDGGGSFAEIGFLGRKDELKELEDFLSSSERRIFALYGVPMIGKTKLVNHFLESNEVAKSYKIIIIKLNPIPGIAEQTIKDEVFNGKDFNDFSDFSSNTIIVIQNFEETLKWTGNLRELHDINNEYANIKTFLKKASEIDSIKLILESRFQIHFELFLTDWRTKVKTLGAVQLEGIKKNEFWRFYQSKGFSQEQFEQLCENFDNHTGLLALAYNDAEFLFQNRLIEAYYQPTVITRFLWDLVEHIIDRLEKRETWILCALTFLQNPVNQKDLHEDFKTLPDFQDEFQIADSFNSLANKLLVQLDKGLYDLNPYIREVCYTFLKVRRSLQMQIIKNLPYFKEQGKTPYYDEIRQAQERGDYMFLFDLGRRLRKEGNYNKAIEVFEAGLTIDPKKANVLDEIGITYKWQKKWKKAIETLEKAKKISPNNLHTLNELAICYRENHQLEKAIETLEKAVKLGNIHSYNELAICYRENHQLEKAIETLEKAVKDNPDNVRILNELAICYRENHQLDKAIETLERAVELGNIHSYSELAICYRENQQLDKAVEILEDAQEKYPSDVKILSVLADTYKKNGDIEKAYKTAQRGVKASNWKDSILIKQHRELEKLWKQEYETVKKLKVFLSYSREDEKIKEKLDVQLAGLKRNGKISTWNDREISPGTEWDSKIKQELDNADIILLLVSADFIASEYIWESELKEAIEKHKKNEAVVIPIFCRACDFSEMPFAKLDGLPKDAKFIKSQPNEDEALTEVAKGIRKVVEKLLG